MMPVLLDVPFSYVMFIMPCDDAIFEDVNVYASIS